MCWDENHGASAVLDPCRRSATEDACSYQDIVNAYIRAWREHAERERQFFERCGSLKRAIEYAALSKLPSGKRHPHQRRVPREALVEAESVLQEHAAELLDCKSFDNLHAVMKRRIWCILGIGRLTVYDIATRIGAHLKLEPERVYLHAGTRVGAKALGLDHWQGTLDVSELPEEFRHLRAYEIEDCLCLFKDELAEIDS